MKRTLLSYFSVCLMLCAVFTACDDEFEGETFVTPTDIESEMSCTTLMEKYPEDFSLWLEMLKYADYYNGLKDADAVATVFAPTNEAIQEFLEWQGVSTIQELDHEYARYVVQNHIINGVEVNSETFVNNAVEGLAIGTQSLFQSYLTPTFGRIITDVDDADRSDEVLDSETLFINNQAAVQPRDSGGIHYLEAANSIIYYMDDVIRPLAETMIDKLDDLEEYSIFVAAARDCGYDKVVSKVRDTIRVQGGGTAIKTYQFTCFAPNDAAMQAAGIQSLDGLKARCIQDNPEAGDSALWQYVAYHFFDQSYTRENFFSFDTPDQTLIYDTSLKAQVVTCMNDSSTGVMIPLINEKARVLRSNIEARNGIIHKIDYYLPVWSPAPVEVKWDFCNSADIISFVNGYGAYNGYGEYYYTPLTNTEKNIDLAYNEGEDSYRDGQFGEITSFTYKANDAKASPSKYRKVGFKKCKYMSTKDKTVNAYDAYLNNLLVLNLGYAGWIQFTTPTIIKGKYKVTLRYGSEATMRSFHAAGSLTKFQIDPEKEIAEWTQNKYVFKGLPTTGFTYGHGEIVLFDEIEFDESSIHTFRATMLDINAKTNGSYHQLWDYLLFTPI